MLKEFSDELVPVIVPAKGGGTQSVRVFLTSSKEDKDFFEVRKRYFQFFVCTSSTSLCKLIFGLNIQRELQNVEEEQNKRVRGFREVIDLISASQKPVVSHNSLNGLSLFD